MNDWYERNGYGLTLTSAAATEPLTTAQAKTHLRVDTSDEDTYIDTLIAAARAHVENWIGRRLVTQTWDLKRDEFPVGSREIAIPYGPVQSITSIYYINTGGTSTLLAAADYVLDTASLVARVYPAYSLIWPATRDQRLAVTIKYVAGYGTAASVPANILHAMKLLIGHWYENREHVTVGVVGTELPQAVQALLSAERASWV